MNSGITLDNLLLSLFITFITGIILFPCFIQWQKNHQFGQKIKKEGPDLHLHKENTPSMGGIIIFFAFLLIFLIGRRFDQKTILSILLLAGYTLLGFIDDWYKIFLEKPWGMKARYKVIFQILIAGLILWLSLDWIPLQIGIPFTHLIISIPRSLFLGYGIFIIIAASNAFNITDGLDGLAAGSGILSYFFWGFFLFFLGERSISYLAFGGVGGLIALLWFNTWPARIFMGDSGSLGLGALMGFMALISGQSLLLIFSALVFIVDTLSVVLQVFSFKILNRRLFLMSPIHHHFELKKMKETQITVRFWIIQAIGITIAWLGRVR